MSPKPAEPDHNGGRPPSGRFTDATHLSRLLYYDYGIRPNLDREERRVFLAPDDRASLPPHLVGPVETALADHQDDLYRNALFAAEHARLCSWMTTTHGKDCDGPECRAALAALADNEYHERLNEAWADGSLTEFEQTLSGYMRHAARAFKAALEAPANHSPDNEPSQLTLDPS